MRVVFHLLAVIGLISWPTHAVAHRLDEYLQATLVDIDSGKIRLNVNLTAGEAVAETVLALVDRNHDGVISTNESAAYAEQVKRDLTARIDGREVELKVASVSFPELAEIRSGWGIIMVEYEAVPGSLPAGPHTFTFSNRHLPAVSVYLCNATQPHSAAVRIVGQKRNHNQSESEIGFDFAPPILRTVSTGAGARLATLLAVLLVVVIGVWWKVSTAPVHAGQTRS